MKYREMRHSKADLSAPVKARTAFGQWFLDGPKTSVHSRGHSVFVPILVPRARRFFVTWSYGYEILAILVRNRVWLSRELRECMNVFIVSIQNE